jgi:hypothetical protein
MIHVFFSSARMILSECHESPAAFLAFIHFVYKYKRMKLEASKEAFKLVTQVKLKVDKA